VELFSTVGRDRSLRHGCPERDPNTRILFDAGAATHSNGNKTGLSVEDSEILKVSALDVSHMLDKDELFSHTH